MRLSLRAGGILILGTGLSLGLSLILIPDQDKYLDHGRLIYDAAGQVIDYRAAADTRLRFTADLKHIDPLYLNMLLMSEDQRFYLHPGVDPAALIRAAIFNLIPGHITSGASTLAMQTVRLLKPRPRTLISKVQEALGAVGLTISAGREEILRRYLTLAPYGGRVEGIHAAALAWFGHEADKLSPAEAALLTALPRAPEALRPDKHPEAAEHYRNAVLDLAVKHGLLAYDTAQDAKQEPLPRRQKPLSAGSLQLGNTLFARSQDERIYTFLEPEVMQILHRQAHWFAIQYPEPLDAAMLVIETRSGKVTGYLGGVRGRQGENDLLQAVRSPGSALKPFAYAMAFDRGQLRPESLLYDQKVTLGTWQPRNFDHSFKGEISAAQALQQSLNLPALQVINLIGSDTFTDFLNQDGTILKLPRGALPNDGIILGAAGIKPYDLAALYAMLANSGRKNTLRLVSKDPAMQRAWLSEFAADTTVCILNGTPRPSEAMGLPALSYKTGTSAQGRDALAAGSYGRYTALVWVGRADNAPVNGNRGLSTAAPMLAGILSALTPAAPAMPYCAGTAMPKQSSGFKDNPLKITFPPADAVIWPDPEGMSEIEIQGGTPPYTLFVNGEEQPDSKRIKVKPGLMELSVLDAKGRSTHIKIYAGKD